MKNRQNFDNKNFDNKGSVKNDLGVVWRPCLIWAWSGAHGYGI